MAFAENLAVFRIEPGAAGKNSRCLGVIGGGVAGHHAGVQPLFLGDPERRLPSLAEPAGQPDMVGVVMRDEDPPHRPAAEPLGEDLLPKRGRLRAGIAAIDDGPARAVFEQPQIDVVEREGQRHPQPQDAGGDRMKVGRSGRCRDRKIECVEHVP